MPVYELKVEVDLGAVEPLEELLGEREEQRLMVLEDKPAGLAWLAGYFESHAAAEEAWAGLAGAVGSWAKAGPDVRELPDADWASASHIDCTPIRPIANAGITAANQR